MPNTKRGRSESSSSAASSSSVEIITEREPKRRSSLRPFSSTLQPTSTTQPTTTTTTTTTTITTTPNNQEEAWMAERQRLINIIMARNTSISTLKSEKAVLQSEKNILEVKHGILQSEKLTIAKNLQEKEASMKLALAKIHVFESQIKKMKEKEKVLRDEVEKLEISEMNLAKTVAQLKEMEETLRDKIEELQQAERVLRESKKRSEADLENGSDQYHNQSVKRLLRKFKFTRDERFQASHEWFLAAVDRADIGSIRDLEPHFYRFSLAERRQVLGEILYQRVEALHPQLSDRAINLAVTLLLSTSWKELFNSLKDVQSLGMRVEEAVTAVAVFMRGNIVNAL